MGQALYRKYRSKSLDEIVGQEHITTTLSQAIKTNRISHAYLFTGPRGVGKTSIARILAHDINNLEYSENTNHIDIIEIDAASNGRVEEIRDLREKFYVTPTSARYKVYIIDEVHMVTKPAFNALLKILEEPPAHVVFIMATTDPQKLPDTIISRTQRFQFRPVELSKVVAHLSFIAQQENIAIEEPALELIAEHGQGSFRDSISLLDQAANYGSPITADTVGALIGVPPRELVNQLIDLLGQDQVHKIIAILNQFFMQGFPANIVASQIAKHLRSQLIAGQNVLSPSNTLKLLKELIDVSASNKPEQLLEITLLNSCYATASILKPEASPIAQATLPTPEPKPIIPQTKIEQDKAEVKKKSTVSEKKKVEHQPDSSDLTTKQPTEIKELSKDNWQQVLDLLKTRYNTLYGLVRMATLDLSKPGRIQLKFAYAFHIKRLNEPKNKQIVADAIKEVIGKDLIIENIVDKGLLSTTSEKPLPKNDLSAISSVFGGGEPIG